jgi:hypothetical protein
MKPPALLLVGVTLGSADERHPTAPLLRVVDGQPGRPYQGSRLSLSVWIRYGSVQPLVPPGRLFDERSRALLSTEVLGVALCGRNER